jgi:hypothetical protein
VEYLFSYGTLQFEKVQFALYGRLLKGINDELTGYTIIHVENTDMISPDHADEKVHRLAIKTDDVHAKIEGTVFELSEEELLLTDRYEPAGFKRGRVTLQSGTNAWIYTGE